ncbi:MAG: phosphotransferase, partial [Alphaproteobacteria bacterium]|nr:phosphotransferase [Alphaproteobacteria bacterium]
MSERLELLNTFLKQNHWDDADRKLLAADASFRHYDRLTRGAETMVLMDAPPPMEDVRPFLTIAKKLEELGYSAPHVYAQDEENGFVLLEDLGDSTYTRLLKNGEDERKLYELATDLLIDLHKRDEANVIPEALPPYDEEALKKEVMLVPDWFMPAAFGKETDKDVVDDFVLLWEELYPIANNVPKTLVLRDYHVDNLMRLDGRLGVKACGLLDFQDALHGTITYDIMS